jgi:flagellar motor switch protein FliN/FliY
VVITTPRVTICKGQDYLQEFEKPVVATEVSYTQGLDGHNVFVLKKEDALAITGLLMGGGSSAEEIDELYLSAMSEVMNQMVGASSTALADILHVHVNISPPVTTEFNQEGQIIGTVLSDDVLVRINFKMEIEDFLVSYIMQLMPFAFGKKLAASLLSGGETAPARQEVRIKATDFGSKESMEKSMDPVLKRPQADEKKTLDLKTAKFQSFDEGSVDKLVNASQQNIDLIIDVPLQVTVVLGKTKKSIREILDLGLGSVIVLDRLAGEMVDVLVNGKAFARGEVVVIDDNYGIRITEMVSGQMKM